MPEDTIILSAFGSILKVWDGTIIGHESWWLVKAKGFGIDAWVGLRVGAGWRKCGKKQMVRDVARN